MNNKLKMKIFVHADDFGITESISNNIIDTFNYSLNSTSIVTNCYYYENAMKIYQQNYKNKIRLALHLNLVEGKPENKSCAINMRKYFKKNLWLEKFKKDPNWEDSKELNEIAQKPEIIHHRLPPAWNIKNSPGAYFTHMWGALKKNNPNALAIIRARNILKQLR